jgi:hypothetical protein
MGDLVIIPSLAGPQYEVVSTQWGWYRVYVWVNEVHDKAAAEFYPVRAQLSWHTFVWRAHRAGRRWVAARRLEQRLVAERPGPDGNARTETP